MKNFFKYLKVTKEDENWGLFLKVAGREIIPENTDYPDNNHPTSYYFLWEHGRILNEFQLNYITEGSGIYEDETGLYILKPGTFLIIRPGVWHRYRPNSGTGWTENYIGMDGTIARTLLSNKQFFDQNPVIIVGEREEFIDTYQKIFDLVLEERPGYQQVAAGMIMKLLGYILSSKKQGFIQGNRIEKIIREVCCYIHKNIEKDLDFKKVSEDYNLGYSYFRKMFKKYTGLPPVKYHLDLKIDRSRDILLTSGKSIKEISFDLGFQSYYYFSRAFKNKLGVSPCEIRHLQNGVRKRYTNNSLPYQPELPKIHAHVKQRQYVEYAQAANLSNIQFTEL